MKKEIFENTLALYEELIKELQDKVQTIYKRIEELEERKTKLENNYLNE